jgi:nicotinamidase-related amidase
MGSGISFDVSHTALLAMDCQAGIVSIYAKPEAEFIERASRVLSAGRSAGMLTIHVQVGFRPSLPEVSERNKLFSALKSSLQSQTLFQGSAGAIHPALGPAEHDIVVTKHRVSAFAGTDLEMILRAKQVDTLVLFGIATSGVVLSTLLEASDADHRVVAIADCCSDTTMYLTAHSASGDLNRISVIEPEHAITTIDFDEAPEFLLDAFDAGRSTQVPERSGVTWFCARAKNGSASINIIVIRTPRTGAAFPAAGDCDTRLPRWVVQQRSSTSRESQLMRQS